MKFHVNLDRFVDTFDGRGIVKFKAFAEPPARLPAAPRLGQRLDRLPLVDRNVIFRFVRRHCLRRLCAEKQSDDSQSKNQVSKEGHEVFGFRNSRLRKSSRTRQKEIQCDGPRRRLYKDAASLQDDLDLSELIDIDRDFITLVS